MVGPRTWLRTHSFTGSYSPM